MSSLGEFLERAKALNHVYNSFTHLQTHLKPSNSSGQLQGKILAIKANIATTELPTSCASRMLENYISPFDATCVQRLKEQGAIIIGKTNMDEFGMGSFNLHSHHGPVINPRYPQESRLAGGSSGGSAAAVAMGSCFAALGSDTGGSIRLPAAFCGVVGFKPSYGAISRWGLVAYASSLDTVGIVANKVSDVRLVFDVIKGQDPKDSTSWEIDSSSRHEKLKDLNGIRIGVPQEYNIEGISPKVMDAWSEALYQLEKQGAEIVPISLPNTKYALSAYYTIAPAEASSNLARYDGIRYGTISYKLI
jgi:aspartyl-tRNA(Asn)/glutamyl-tRNA(Gln) amidotransferase subunit A